MHRWLRGSAVEGVLHQLTCLPAFREWCRPESAGCSGWFQTVPAESGVQLNAGDAKAPGRLGLVPPSLAHDLLDGSAFHDIQVGCGGRGRRLNRLQREMLGRNQSPLAENRGPFERIA